MITQRMWRPLTLAAVWLVWICGMSARTGAAEFPPQAVAPSAHVCDGDCPRCTAAGQNDRRRAGRWQTVARYALPSRTRHYGPYYVGGGAVLRGEPRYPDEGTWGMDYRGMLFPKRVLLNWWHGRHEQGGSGSYTTDGPHLPRH